MQRLLEELRGVRSNFKFYLEDGTEGQRIVFQVGAGATILSVLFLSIFFVLLLRSAWSSAQVVFGGESLALLSSEEFSLFFVLLLLLLFILGVQGALLFCFLHRDKYFLTESGLSRVSERFDFKNRRMVSEERVLLKREEGELGIYDHEKVVNLKTLATSSGVK